MFSEIIKDLERVIQKIEQMDDPTMDEKLRDKIGEAHSVVEDCIYEIDKI